MFTLSANKSSLWVGEREKLYSGSKKVYVCEFSFDNDWDGLNRTVSFRAGKKIVNGLYRGENRWEIPWEALEHYGQFLFVSVTGTNGTGTVLPTMWASLGRIEEGGELGADAREPSPDVYAQILAQYSETAERVEALEGKSPVTVTAINPTTASHTGDEITDLADMGHAVMFNDGYDYWPLSYAAHQDGAFFSRVVTDGDRKRLEIKTVSASTKDIATTAIPLSETVTVTIRYNEDGDPEDASHTAKEIYDLAQAGNTVQMVGYNGRYCLLDKATETLALFYRVEKQGYMFVKEMYSVDDHGFVLDESVTISKMPNPEKLHFTGAANFHYDGSHEKTVEIPIILEPLVATITHDGRGNYASDKTLAEIRAAHEEGRECFALVPPNSEYSAPEPVLVELFEVDSGTARFERIFYGYASEPYLMQIEVREDHVTFRYTEVKANSPNYLIFEGGSDELYDGSRQVVVPIPTELPNPEKLSFSGAYSGEYDGSNPLTVPIPEKLPNPQKIKFTGAVTGEYDGSTEVTVEIPEGGGGSAPFVVTVTSQGGYTADKTYAQIQAAYQAGQQCYCDISSFASATYAPTRLGLLYVDDFSAKFESLYRERSNGDITARIVEITTGNVVTFHQRKPNAENPYKLKFTGAVEAEYDGGEEVTVEIPEGGGNVVYVTVESMSDDGMSGTVSHSASEIKALVEGGAMVAVSLMGMGVIPLLGFEENSAMFAYTITDADGTVVTFPMMIAEDKTFTAVPRVSKEVPDVLPNPQALTFTGAVTGSYNGSAAKTVNIPVVPAFLPNPNYLTFTGAVNATYDGSSAVTVNIPMPEADIIYNGPAEVVLDDGMGYATMEGVPTMAAGKTYQVTWDGVKYECTAVGPIGDDIPALAGNLSFVDAGADTGEPFLLVSYSVGMLIAATKAEDVGTHTLKVALAGNEMEYIDLNALGLPVHTIGGDRVSVTTTQEIAAEIKAKAIERGAIGFTFSASLGVNTIQVRAAGGIAESEEEMQVNGLAWFAGYIIGMHVIVSTDGTISLRSTFLPTTTDMENYAYSKNEIDTALGAYITDVAALIGGDA